MKGDRLTIDLIKKIDRVVEKNEDFVFDGGNKGKEILEIIIEDSDRISKEGSK